ncbi:MAG: thiamine pyrophosphate-binding protein [Thermoleophilia bacterium]|jgi:benzoylformate decarboxylase
MSSDAANGADWLCAALAEQGVEVLFGNPGSTELPLTGAIGRAGDPRYVLGLHEATVLGMADGYAQATGRLAAVNVHVQPGLANAMSGILNAARARVPLLVTVGQQVQGLLPGAPFLGGELVEMARPLVKGAWEVATADALPATLALAIGTALRPPRGPVMVSLPLDVQVAPGPSPFTRVDSPPVPLPDPGAVAAAAQLLAGAASPVVVAGDEVARSGASASVAALAERLGAPLFGEPFGATVPVATDHPHWRGPLPSFATEIRRALEGYDLVVAIGMPVFRLFGDSPGQALPEGCRLVHLEVDPDEVGRVHTPAVGIVGDLPAAAFGLLDRLGPAGELDRGRAARTVRAAAAARAAARARVIAAAPSAGTGISPEAFALAIADAVGPGDLVVDEALTAGRSLRHVISRRTAQTWLAHRGSALGWGLPAAVGAAIADPRRRVMALQGDGSLLFGIHALWTAAHERAPVALVVADNGGYEILRAGMEGLTGRPGGAWPGLAITDPSLDIPALCRGFGASAERVTTRDDLPDALRDLWKRADGGPAALVVRVGGPTAPVGYPLTP